jgi:putative transposase
MSIRIQAARADHHTISVVRRCELLKVNRSTVYYQSDEPDQEEIWLMNLIRDIWLQYPFYGYRKITRELRVVYGHMVNHKRVLRLMNAMEIEALRPKPKTSIKMAGHVIYPYLLRNMEITHPNQVWMVDLTYIKFKSGFVYLIALIDVYSRYVVGWSLAETMHASGCLDALKQALKLTKPVKPEIINTDQGSQFTSAFWIITLLNLGIKISMDGKGRCLDNVYIERFWRSIKYEAIHLNEYDCLKELHKGIKHYIQFYNDDRYHQSLNYETPVSVYFGRKKA